MGESKQQPKESEKNNKKLCTQCIGMETNKEEVRRKLFISMSNEKKNEMSRKTHLEVDKKKEMKISFLPSTPLPVLSALSIHLAFSVSSFHQFQADECE